MLGAIALDDRIWKDGPPEAIAKAMLDGVRDLGPSGPGDDDAARRLHCRAWRWARDAGQDLPDMSEAALMATLDDWLLPHLSGVRSMEGLEAVRPDARLTAHAGLAHSCRRWTAPPGSFTTPLGREIPIDYTGDHPRYALRLQEMFGQKTHPDGGQTPL